MEDTQLPEDPDMGLDLEEEHHEVVEKKSKKKRDAGAFRKAPQAPKRFKSSYICFFMAKQPEIKEQLGDKATVTEVSKRSAEMWRNLPADQRAHWDEIAARDKARYMVEKASYTGPWQVPWKRQKKDPSAPKRPMSAFLYFSQDRRGEIKKEHPEMRNTEISRKLGQMWRDATPEERLPHIEREKKEREKYKVRIAEWRKEAAEKEEKKRKAQAEQQAYMASMYTAPPPETQMPESAQQQMPPQMLPEYGEAQVMGSQPPAYPGYGYGAPPGGMMPPYGSSLYAPYPPTSHNAPYPHASGKQVMVLGPNGMPAHYQSPYGGVPPPAPYEENETGSAPPPPSAAYDYAPRVQETH